MFNSSVCVFITPYDAVLSNWVPRNKAKLDELNFIWQKVTPRISWEERLEALKQFKEEHGEFILGSDLLLP